MAKKQAQSRQFEVPQDIVLWGPTQSGKDWLIRAFVKELDRWNIKDDKFRYELFGILASGTEPYPVSPEPPLNILPTLEPKDLSYIFRRIPKTSDRTLPQEHSIIIHNDQGAVMIDSLQDKKTFSQYYFTLMNARNVIIVMGLPAARSGSQSPKPTPQSDDHEIDEFEPSLSMTDNQVDAIHSQKARTQDWSKDDYYEFIRILLREFEKGPARNIAVCLTKSDQDSMHGRSWDIFERRYDKRIRSLLEMYRIDPAQPENNIRKHNIEVFITSSAGYLYNLTTLKYEKNFINGVLLNPDDWNPYNATSPFFWIFEQIEKGRGQKGIFTSSPQDPTPYPIIVNT